ncbi:unnamed protein product [Calypogeia fissa]
MAFAAAASPWLNCSPVGSTAVRCNAEIMPRLRSNGVKAVRQEFLSLKPCRVEKYRKSARSQFQHSSPSWRDGRLVSPVLRSTSSSSSSVEEDEAVDDGGFEGSPEGSNEESRDDLMKAVMQKLSEEDLEEAAKKYRYEDELFAQIDFAQINAFTSKAFSGNPAAVCYLPYERDDKWLQLIAREFNLPATAFVVKRRVSRKNRALAPEAGGSSLIEVDDSAKGLKPVKKIFRPVENEFDIRWFSTTAELEICGHATLASAHMLFSSGLVDGDVILFHSKKGPLKATKIGYDETEDSPETAEENEDQESRIKAKAELGKGVVELDFPLNLVSHVDVSEAQAVSDALGGVETVWVGRTSFGDYLVELPSSKHVEQLEPLAERMINLPGRGVIATARASEDSEFDIISRFFAPKFGIPEDPVTGSAHCALGPYWGTKLGTEILKAYQASPRGGEISVRVDLDAGRVYLQGGAVLLMAGTLLNTYRI